MRTLSICERCLCTDQFLQKRFFISVFLFRYSQTCLHFCTRIPPVTHESHSHVDSHVAQDFKITAHCVLPQKHSYHLHITHACTWAFHLRLSLSFSFPYPRHLHLRSRCRSINTALIHRMKSMALWPKQPLLQVMSPSRSTTSTTQRLIQRSSRMNPST